MILFAVAAAALFALGIWWWTAPNDAFRRQLTTVLSSEASSTFERQHLPTSKWALYWYRAVKDANVTTLLITPTLPGLVAAATAVTGFTIPIFMGKALLAPVFAVGSVWLLHAVLRRAGKGTRARFDQQVPTLLDALRVHIASGATPGLALREAANELDAPAGPTLRQLLASADRTGGSTVDVLRVFAKQNNSGDLEFMVSSFARAVDSGADLSPQLKTLSGIVESRFKLKAQIAKGLAEVKLQLLLLYLPGVAFVGQALFSSSYLENFMSPIGVLLLVFAAAVNTGALFAARAMIRKAQRKAAG